MLESVNIYCYIIARFVLSEHIFCSSQLSLSSFMLSFVFLLMVPFCSKMHKIARHYRFYLAPFLLVIYLLIIIVVFVD